MKEIRISPRIAQHDLETKANSVRRLLKKDKVKVSVVFRGREFSHLDIGITLVKQIADSVADIAHVEARVAKDRQCFIILVGGGESAFKHVS